MPIRQYNRIITGLRHWKLMVFVFQIYRYGLLLLSSSTFCWFFFRTLFGIHELISIQYSWYSIAFSHFGLVFRTLHVCRIMRLIHPHNEQFFFYHHHHCILVEIIITLWRAACSLRNRIDSRNQWYDIAEMENWTEFQDFFLHFLLSFRFLFYFCDGKREFNIYHVYNIRGNLVI